MRFGILLLSALLAHTAVAAEGDHEFRIGPRIGKGEIRIDAAKPISSALVDRTREEDTVGLGGTFEYRAPFGLVLEVGHYTHGESDWWDDDSLVMTETTGSIGWQFDLGNGFSLIPRVGRARWKVEDDVKWWDDDDEINPTIRGYQNYWEVSAMKRLNSVISLGVSHRQSSFDFGRAHSTVFTAMFNIN